jgi:PAS domain S-box-containing protein
MRNLPNFSCWSLRAKLVSIIMLSSVVCLLVSLSVLAISSASSRYKDSLDQLTGLANILAENSQAALVFSDRIEAKRLLESLESHHEISSAWLVTDKGIVLSSWSRKGAEGEVPANYRVQTMQLHSGFWSSRAKLYMPVTRGTEQIGYILLKVDFTERWEKQLVDLGEGLGAGGLALLVVFLLSIRLQRVISRPLGDIADTARTIARDKTYGLRVSQHTNDEVGDLVNAFNGMLREIQERDEHLIIQRDHLEEEVDRRTEELRTIFENTPDTIARYDYECRRTFVNPALGAMTDGGIAKLLGKKPSEHPGGSQFEIYETRIKEVFTTGKESQFELEWPSNDDIETYIHIRLIPEYDLSDTVTSVLAVGRDISERKRQEWQLAKLSFALNRVNEAVFLIDKKGRFLFVNDEVSRALGYTREELTGGMSVPDISHGFTDEMWAEHWQDVKSKGFRTLESSYQAKDGRTFPIEVNANYFEYHEQGYIMSMVRDITERKVAEQNQKRLAHALQFMSKCDSVLVRAEKEQELLTEICRLAVESGGYLMAWVGYAENDAGRTVRKVAQSGYEQGYLDDANITWADTERGRGPIGIAIREGVTVPIQDLQSNPKMAPWREDAFKRGYKSCIALPLVINKQVQGVLTIYAAESFSFGKEEVSLLEELTNDLAYGIQALRIRVEHDTSELALKNSVRLLEEKELAKTRFLAAAGHDMRQPIAAANLFVEALKFTSPNQQQSELIARLDQSMHVFSNMLERLLDISRFDAGLVKTRLTSFNVEELLKWLDHNFAQVALDKQLRFRLFFPASKLLVVRTDIGLVQSVLMNLVSNAIKFTAHGSILISTRLRGDKVLVQVWDTGIGIAEEDIPLIFEEFYQVANPQRSREVGLGLGLSICQRAMHVLGSEVTCRSRLGHGSVFQFSLPLDSKQHELEQHTNNTPSDDFTGEMLFRGKSVVLVEDDTLVAQAMAGLLKIMGGKVRCFPNAEDALRCADIEHADYYIVDYMLGGEHNGIQFLELLRQKRGAAINAVLVTGDTSTNFIRKAERFDWPVLHKPVNMSKLINSLSILE